MSGEIRRSDRVLMVGPTRSGKSTLARALFEANAPPRLVVDPKDDPDATGGVFRDRRQAVTFSDPARLPDADVIRFVPRDPYDADAYSRLYDGAFERRGLFVWLDEAGIVAPSPRGPAGLRRFVTQGARFGSGHLALNQRPVDIDRAITANAEHLIFFDLHHPDDLATVSAHIGMPPSELAEVAGRLPSYGFGWYAARARTLTVCDPIERWR